MNLYNVIQQIKTYCPSYAGNIGGAAQFKQLKETTTLPLPCAFVIPGDDNPSPPMSSNGVSQELVEVFSVIVIIANTIDERGQAAACSAHDTVRAELWAALIGWQPDNLTGRSSRYNGIHYAGGNLLDLDRSRIWYQFDFSAQMFISDADGFQQRALSALPNFDGVTLTESNLDWPADTGRVNPSVEIPNPAWT